MEDIEIFAVLRRYMVAIGLLTIVAGLAGYGFTFLLTERYEAAALVLVRPHQPIYLEAKSGSREFLDFPVGQTATVETASKTYIEIIKSFALVSDVVRALDLDKLKTTTKSGWLFGWIPKSTKDYIKERISDAIAFVKYGRVLKDDPFTKTVKDVTAHLTLKSLTDTYVFEIKYSAESPAVAAAVANTAARLFGNYVEQLGDAEAKRLIASLDNQVEQARQALVKSREALEKYKETHGTFLYEAEYTSKLKVIGDLQVELAKLDEALAGAKGTLTAETYAAKRATVVAELRRREAALADLPLIERQLKTLEVDSSLANTAYVAVAKDAKEAEIKLHDPSPEARIVSPATAPNLPSTPKRGIVTLASLLAGLVIGVAGAFFLEYINHRVRSVRDVEDLAGVKVLATIPRVPERELSEAGL